MPKKLQSDDDDLMENGGGIITYRQTLHGTMAGANLRHIGAGYAAVRGKSGGNP